jgi:hypothetical protein
MNLNGRGYSSREYQDSGIIDQLKALPEDRLMISNSSGFILYYTNRMPVQIDVFHKRNFGRHNGYGERTFREKGAALILILPDFRNVYGDSADELFTTITDGLDVDYRDEVSGIYYYPVQEITQP